MNRLVRDEPSLEKSTRLLEMSVGEIPDCWFKAMADFVEVSLLDVRERNWMAFMLDIRTYKFPNFARDQFTSDALITSEPCIKKYQAKHAQYQTSYLILCLHVNTIVYLEVIENLVEHQNISEMSEKQDQKTEGICF